MIGTRQVQTPTPTTRAHRKMAVLDWVIVLLTLAFIAAFNVAAMSDRMLLIVYAIGVAGAAFVLLKRSAIVFTVVTLAAASTALLVNVYFQASAEAWHPLLDGIRDMVGLLVLALGMAKLIHEAFRIQKEAREAEVQREFEKKLISMRAAALRSTSHEVRTPLSTIITINETLMNGSTGPLSDIQQEFVKDIDDAARHLMSLVNDILDYARAEAGAIKLSPELVAMVELVDQCVTMVLPTAAAAGVNVSAQVSPDVNEVTADPLRLKQILLNLLSNAIKYNEREGVVNLRVRADGDDILISVRDTGRGIAPEHLEHLFNPYYQAARKDQSIGTGLGLAIIKHLTELHGGKITVESVPGTGSVFTVRMPKKTNIQSELAAPALADESSSSSSGPGLVAAAAGK